MESEKRPEWKPAKTRGAVASIQEYIALHPQKCTSLFYLISPTYVFENLEEFSETLDNAGINRPEKATEITPDFVKAFVHKQYGIDIEDCITIEVGRSESPLGWGIAVPESALKDQGVELVHWDHETFISRGAAQRLSKAFFYQYR